MSTTSISNHIELFCFMALRRYYSLLKILTHGVFSFKIRFAFQAKIASMSLYCPLPSLNGVLAGVPQGSIHLSSFEPVLHGINFQLKLKKIDNLQNFKAAIKSHKDPIYCQCKM